MGGAKAMNTAIMSYGIIAAAVALALLWWRHSELRSVALMQATPSTKARDAKAMAIGSFVEIKGILRCPEPIEADFSKQNCAYFDANIFERVPKVSTGTSGQSSSSYDTHTVYSQIHYAPCFVEDDSGQIQLKLEGAAVEGTTTVDTTERTGGEALSLALSIADARGHERRHVEKILPVDVPVYVLGEIHADGSVGKLGALSKNSYFIVSLKSEEERGQEASWTAKWLLIVAAALLALAAGLSVWARIKGAR